MPLFSKKKWPADTVILRQVGRGPYAPSISPFPIKLETYLRLARIPYQNDHNGGMSAKGKTPWITYNDKDVSDSQLCIDFLNKELGIDLYKNLSASDKAIARAFQKMVEEHLYWILAETRFGKQYDADFLYIAFNKRFPKFLISHVLRQRILKSCSAQGIGRHSDDERWVIYTGDMKALADFLGEKKFFMGDKATLVDCSIFGILSQFKWHQPASPHKKFLEEETPKLNEFCERMKETFWPDWDDCITHGGTKKPTA